MKNMMLRLPTLELLLYAFVLVALDVSLGQAQVPLAGTLAVLPSPLTATCHFPSLKKGWAYATAHERVLKAGYFPVPEKKYNFRFCEVWGKAQCRAFPEIEACSADGYCTAHFRDRVGDRLTLVSYGDSENAGEYSVIGWRVSCKNAAPPKK